MHAAVNLTRRHQFPRAACLRSWSIVVLKKLVKPLDSVETSYGLGDLYLYFRPNDGVSGFSRSIKIRVYFVEL
jgi:hypothetical protein